MSIVGYEDNPGLSTIVVVVDPVNMSFRLPRLRHPLFALVAASGLGAQERGAAELHLLVNGLTVSSRVLVLGAHPDDEDTPLIAWLSRGRGVETAYLSLTRGEAGQNFLGAEIGTTLGAVRTQEALAARRVDGAELFYTRAYDFGIARDSTDAFTHWPHQLVLGDIVTIIRSFRPHVLIDVFSDGGRVPEVDGQHQALSILAAEAFAAAADTVRFPTEGFGHPWSPLKLYRHGPGLTINTSEFDGVLGRTFATIALEARARQRTQGVSAISGRRLDRVGLHRVSTRLKDTVALADEKSIFDGIDTSITRFSGATPSPQVGAAIASFVAYADSARAALDLRHSGGVVPLLARATRVAESLRRLAPWCNHPTGETSLPTAISSACDASGLDLDASVDLAQRRATQALLLAAGVSFDVTADRELVASDDTATVTITMYNHGEVPVTLSDVTISGSFPKSMEPVVLPPDSIAREYRTMTGLADAEPWWIGPRRNDMFEPLSSPLDGLARPGAMTAFLALPGVALPEGIRRTSDATVTLSIAGTTVTTSIGPVMYHYADPILGPQDRAVAGVASVTLAFERGLEWVRAHTPVDRKLRVTVKSFSDRAQTFALKIVAPAGLRIDSLPKTLTLASREQRELFLRVRGSLDTGRHVFGIVGESAGGAQYTTGFGVVEYAHIPPVRISRSSALWLRAADVALPSRLTVAYIQGAGDDIAASLKQIGLPVTLIEADQLQLLDLSIFNTVVIGPYAFDAHRELRDQTARLLEFARNGGTVLILEHSSAIQSGVLPFPIAIGRPVPEHVTSPIAPVTAIDSRARLLNWPNVIRADDWVGWVRDRALFVPTAADPRYTTLVEMHDAGQKENRNSILVASVGKGTYIYTALSFSQQIPGGVTGSMRLLVNLLSAGAKK